MGLPAIPGLHSFKTFSSVHLQAPGLHLISHSLSNQCSVLPAIPGLHSFKTFSSVHPPIPTHQLTSQSLTDQCAVLLRAPGLQHIFLKLMHHQCSALPSPPILQRTFHSLMHQLLQLSLVPVRVLGLPHGSGMPEFCLSEHNCMKPSPNLHFE